MKKLKIGLDIHGVIDLYPKEFAWLSGCWERNGHEVHIITGQEWSDCEEVCSNIRHVKHFSIVDYHKSIGTAMVLGKDGWWMSDEDWVKSKGEYARNEGLDIHFDDTVEYFKWFPEDCLGICVPKMKFERYCIDCFQF